MRIISGKFKRKQINFPDKIRPTQDKVRKAIFDILGNIEGMSFLELFAGSGSVGLEAMSLGASKVVFVEKDKECIRKIRGNILLLKGNCENSDEIVFSHSESYLNSEETARNRHYYVIGEDVFKAIEMVFEKNEKFDIIFFDPPYHQNLIKKTLKMLGRYDIVAPNSLIVCQHSKKDFLPEEITDFTVIKEAKYGDTVLTFLEYNKYLN